MYSDLVIPYHDVRNCNASMDQNKSMEGNQSYLRMNSMIKASMTCLKNMNDVLIEDSGWMMETFGSIFYEMISPSSLWLYSLKQKVAHLFWFDCSSWGPMPYSSFQVLVHKVFAISSSANMINRVDISIVILFQA